MKGKITALILTLTILATASLQALTITGDVTILKGQTFTLTNQTYTVDGNFTTQGATVNITNSTLEGTGKLQFTYGVVTIINSTVKNFKSASFLYQGKLVLQNVTFQNVTGQTSLSCITNYEINGLNFINPPVTNVLNLYKMCNGEINGLSYTYQSKDLVGCAVSLIKCVNLTFNNANGYGPRTVDSPHHHILACGTENYGVIIKNSVFNGGGNGATGGIAAWLNCTFINNTDGVEYKDQQPLNFVNCTWIGTHDAEVNLQSGIELNFVGCTFTKGLVSLNNGVATLTNCTFPNGCVMTDLGGNRDGVWHQGVIMQYWNYTHYQKVSVADWYENRQNLNYTLMPD